MAKPGQENSNQELLDALKKEADAPDSPRPAAAKPASPPAAAAPAAARPSGAPASAAAADDIPRFHALETPWTVYADRKLQKASEYKEFEANLKKLGSFNTVEGFWRHYAYLTKPDELPLDHNIFMFRHNYIPAWETFPNGGCWIVKVRKNNGLINRLWEELLFSCIGEQFEEPTLAGVVLSSRPRDDVLSIWNRDNSRYPDSRYKIGEKLKAVLNLDDSTRVEYKFFSTSLRDGSTFRNAKPYVYAAGSIPPSTAEESAAEAGAGHESAESPAQAQH